MQRKQWLAYELDRLLETQGLLKVIKPEDSKPKIQGKRANFLILDDTKKA